MSSSSKPSIEKLKKALEITQKISDLEAQLEALWNEDAPVRKSRVGRPPGSKKAKTPKAVKKAKREMSEEGRERIAAAQRKRWAARAKAAKDAG